MSESVSIIRPVVGLMLSIGLPPESEGNPGNYPKKLDHFRPKPGALMQYLPAAEAFFEAYGPEPRSVDVLFVSDEIDLVFDVRPKAFGTSGLKALGARNLAGLEPEEFQHALYSFGETVDVFPDDDGEIVQYELKGPSDPTVASGKTKMYGVLRFSIPDVTGLMTLAEISTTSRRSMKNLYAGIQLARSITGGHLVGIPLRLAVRPTKGKYLDPKTKTKKSTTFYELVLDSRGSLAELYGTIMERRQILAAQEQVALPPIEHDSLERDEELAPQRRAIEAAADVPAVSVEVFEEIEPSEGEDPGGSAAVTPAPAAGGDAVTLPAPSDEVEGELFPIPERARR